MDIFSKIKPKLILPLIFSILNLHLSLYGQGIIYRPIISVQYNTLNGKGSDILGTSVQGLGSGIYDFSGKFGITHILTPKAHKILFGIDFPVINIEKYRFSYDIYFDGASISVDSLHNFNHNFFSNQGSKLTLISLFTPVYLIYKIPGLKNSYFKAGIYGEYYLWGWHKLIFEEAGTKKTLKTNLPTLKKSGFNPAAAGITIGMRIKQIYLFYTHSLTYLFKNNNISARQNTYGIYYFLSLTSSRKKHKYQKL